MSSIADGVVGDLFGVATLELGSAIDDVVEDSLMGSLVVVVGTDELVTSVGVEMASTHAAQRMMKVDA
jgi:hypothetical protein